MEILEYLRSFKILDYAVFDLIVSFANRDFISYNFLEYNPNDKRFFKY